MLRRMKRFLPLVVLIAAPLFAEEVTVKQSVLLRADRNVVSIKPGTTVELVSRNGNDLVIRYRGLTGKIPASKLDEPKESASTASAPAAKPSEEKKPEAKPAENKPAADKSSGDKPANPPQTSYGKAVQKAKDSAAAHDKNLVKPTDEVTKDAR